MRNVRGESGRVEIRRPQLVLIAGAAVVFGVLGLPGLAETAPSAGEYRLFAPGAASDQRWERSEATDPDESLFDRNDIGWTGLAANLDEIFVRVETADGQLFVLDDHPSLRLEFWWPTNSELGESELVHVLVSAEGVEVFWPSLGLPPVHTTSFVSAGDELRFSLPRSLFLGAREIHWRAFGYDVAARASLPPCDGPSCEDLPYDFAGADEDAGEFFQYAGTLVLPGSLSGAGRE